jgi:hypothetical protein
VKRVRTTSRHCRVRVNVFLYACFVSTRL